MSTSRINQIREALRAAGTGQTPAELGLTSVEANTLAGAGIIVQGDRRRTPGKRGAPPYEYHLPGPDRPAEKKTIDPSYREGLPISPDDMSKLDYIDNALVSGRLDAMDHLIKLKKQILNRALSKAGRAHEMDLSVKGES